MSGMLAAQPAAYLHALFTSASLRQAPFIIAVEAGLGIDRSFEVQLPGAILDA